MKPTTRTFLNVARFNDGSYSSSVPPRPQPPPQTWGTTTTTTNKPPPCRFFQTPQGCRFGDACNFSHDMPKTTSSMTEEIMTCSICLQPLHGPLSLLPQCGHVYCYQCLKDWRGSEMADYDRTKQTARSCPQCRVVSYFAVPCSVPPRTREEIDELVKTFKERCATKPCRNADKCPFGASCLFQHSQSQALAVDSDMKFVVNDDGKTITKSSAVGTLGEYLLR